MPDAHTLHPLIRLLADLAGDLARSLGPGYEVVVHDLSRPENSIVAIAGDVTGRQVGSPVTDLVLRLLKANRTDRNLLHYKTQCGNKVLRSSTLFIRDEEGNTIGCLCINHDITPWLFIKGLASAFTRTEDPLAPQVETQETFPIDVPDLLRQAVQRAVERTGTPLSLMDKSAKISVVRALDEQGIFRIRGGLSYVARELGVSRYSVYNYLGEARERTEQEDEAEAGPDAECEALSPRR